MLLTPKTSYRESAKVISIKTNKGNFGRFNELKSHQTPLATTGIKFKCEKLSTLTWVPKAREGAVLLSVSEGNKLVLFGGTDSEHAPGFVQM